MEISLKQAIEYIVTKHKPEKDEEEELLNGFDRKKTFKDISPIKLSVGKLRQLLRNKNIYCRGYISDGIPSNVVWAFEGLKEKKESFEFDEECEIVYSKSLEDYWGIEAYDEYNKFYIVKDNVKCCNPTFNLENLEQYIEKPINSLEQFKATEDIKCGEDESSEQPKPTEDDICSEDGSSDIPKTIKLSKGIGNEVKSLYDNGIKNETAIINYIADMHKGEKGYSKGNVKRYVRIFLNKNGLKVVKNKQGRPRKNKL